jgi:ureidoacrylate peracid hydrolase
MVAEITSELGALIVPDQSALLVVDVQNDVCHDEGTFGRSGIQMGAIQAAVENLVEFIETARRARVPVLFIKTHHDRWNDSPAWLTREARKSKGEICATGSWGAEFYKVSPATDECAIVKHRYSAFVGTSLEVVLRTLARPTLLLAGITTNVCVESTARDAFMRDYHVVLVEDCAAAATKEEHEATLHNMRAYFGHVLDSRSIAASWHPTPNP